MIDSGGVDGVALLDQQWHVPFERLIKLGHPAVFLTKVSPHHECLRHHDDHSG